MWRLGVAGAVVTVLFGVSAAGCGGGGGNGDPSGTGGDPTGGGGSTGAAGAVSMNGSTYTVTVDGATNSIVLGSCGVTPATIDGVAAGSYSLTLTASTLSKGGVSGPTPPPPSHDDYVIIHLPLAPGDPNENHRFFMLNGVGTSASVSLSGGGTIEAMFVDSDTSSNGGMGTVTLTPGGMTATVSGAANVIAYDAGCRSMPAVQTLSDGRYRATLADSTLSSGNGAHDDFVLVRTPSEQPMEPDRYVILNGVGASHDFAPYNAKNILIWYIGATPGSGQAHVTITRL
jgi:hypothetical protein